jgi:agmatinase
MKNTPYNFLGIPDIPLKDARFVILPVPFEATTSCLPGTREGPSSIIAASNYIELFDEQLQSEPYLAGIKTLPELPADYQSLKKMVSGIGLAASKYITGRGEQTVVGLGGEHTVSLGIVEAYARKYPGLNVASFDAHADLRDTYQGTKFSHACVMRRIMECGCRIYTAGVRSISREEHAFLESADRAEILFAHKMDGNWAGVFNRMLPSGNYYISFDLDFLDPSVLPETGTPEPGGFYWNETVSFFRQFILREDIQLVGFDVVELAPKGKFTPSAFLAAKLVYKIIGLLALKNRYLKR